MLSASAYICRIINRRRKDESISVNGEPVAVYRLALTWLAGKLLEDSQGMLEEPQEEYISKEEVLEKIDSGLKDVKAGNTMSARELLEELRHEL